MEQRALPADSGPLRAAPADCEGGDAPPPSQVRELGAPQTTELVIQTRLTGAEAENAWVTVTRSGGLVDFEGPLCADGRATVTLSVAPGAARVSVRLETLRWHRQAEVDLQPGTGNVYAFS